MPQPLIELGGSVTSPTLHMAPANGFVPQTYLPMLRSFVDSYHVVSAVPRALWGDQQPPSLQNAPDWMHIADDLLGAFQLYDLRDVVAIGHSFGGVASMNAAIKNSSRFRALILLDPTFLPEPILDMLTAAMEQGMSDQHPLAQGALKRKREFKSVEAFYERYRSKPTFADWDEEVMRLYAEYGTQPSAHGRTLTWSPEWEAFYFSTGFAETWRTIGKLNGLLPTLIIRGGTSDTYIEDSATRVRDLVPSATHLTIAGHGHLFPQSAPQETARVIGEWLREIAG